MDLTKKNVLAIVSFAIVVLGFVVSLFASGKITIDGGYTGDTVYKISSIVWGAEKVTRTSYSGESFMLIGAHPLSIMGVGSVVALLSGALFTFAIISANEKKGFFAFGVIIILAGVMMFLFKNRISGIAQNELMIDYDDIKSVGSGGCVFSGILYVAGGIVSIISSFLEDY